MDTLKPKDVQSYIANSVAEARPIMNELREVITSTIPDAEEVISYNVPMYKYYGILVGFDAFKNHVTFGADALNDRDRELLKEKGYKTGKKTIQIKFDQKVPVVPIKKIVMRQAKINEGLKGEK